MASTATLNPHPWRRLVRDHPANLQARQNAKYDERDDRRVRVLPEPPAEQPGPEAHGQHYEE